MSRRYVFTERDTDREPVWAPWIMMSAHVVLALLALETLVAVPALSWDLLFQKGKVVSVSVGVVAAVLLLSALWVLRDRTAAMVAGFSTWAVKPNDTARLWAIWALGLSLRLVWLVVFPIIPSSDAATYLSLAHRLIAGEEYQVAGLRAYWPPGYALILSLWLRLPLPEQVAIATLNLALYSLTVLVGYYLAGRLAGRRTGVLAALLIAVWPSMLTTCGVASKELFVIAMLMLALFLFTAPGMRRVTWLMRLGAGLSYGMVVLTQPSLVLFPAVLLAFTIVTWRDWRRHIVHLLLFLIGAAIVVSPWTLRNEKHFDRLVLITTNGGSNFYRANNPLATGGYTPQGEVDISNLGEIDASREGYRLGSTWIRDNPMSFARLSLWKNLLFLGDDSYGVYETLRRNSNETTILYLVLKGASNLFWLVVWAMLLYCVVTIPPSVFWTPGLLLCLMTVLYFWGIHSVFESSSKYHLPMLPCLAILIANGVTSPKKSATRHVVEFT